MHTKSLLHKSKMHQKRDYNLRHQLLLDKASKTINQICFWLNALLRVPKNLWRGSTIQNVKAEQTIERDSWQPKVLIIRGPKQNCWLIDNALNVHVCNNLRLMTNFTEKPTKIGRSIADRLSPKRGIVWIKLVLEDRSKKVIHNLRDIFYLPNSP